MSGIRAIEKGAIVFGSMFVPKEGFFVKITILTNVLPGNSALDEEVFSPVFSIEKAVSEGEGVKYSYQRQLGVGGLIWIRETVKRQKKLCFKQLPELFS